MGVTAKKFGNLTSGGKRLLYTIWRINPVHMQK